MKKLAITMLQPTKVIRLGATHRGTSWGGGREGERGRGRGRGEREGERERERERGGDILTSDMV